MISLGTRVARLILNGGGWGRSLKLEQEAAIPMSNLRRESIHFSSGLKRFVGRMSLSMMKRQSLLLEMV